jgi:single-stranded DNA-binding protein
MADLSVRRTLVYVEGDASMSQYQDAEGKPRSSLNLVQRKLPLSLQSIHNSVTDNPAEKLEVLSPKKPQ